MPGFLITKQINAPVETVFDVLTDHEGTTSFMPGPVTFTLEKPGTTEPNGVGAVRRISGAGPAIREEVLRYEPSTHFSYGIISGAPVKDHRGDVVLEAKDGGTAMTYRVTFDAILPLRPVMLGVMRGVVGTLVSGIVKTSEARAAKQAA
ncbi:MAG: lactoylglutathione lyase-like lyase [Solirubrobacterales bacterium]|nr:lactoylglutathione lyase-like lyase [Solirubrobacterales bacterium]